MTVMSVGSWYDDVCWQLVWQSFLLAVGMTVLSVGSWYDSHVCRYDSHVSWQLI